MMRILVTLLLIFFISTSLRSTSGSSSLVTAALALLRPPIILICMLAAVIAAQLSFLSLIVVGSASLLLFLLTLLFGPLLLHLCAQVAVLVVRKPSVTDAALVVIAIVEGVGRRERYQVASVSFDALGEILCVGGSSFLWEGAHRAAAQVILWVQVEEVEQVEVDLGAVVRCVRLSTEFNIALLVAIEDVRGGTEGWEDLAQFVVLIWLEESCSDLVHGGHGAAWGHVDPQSRKETEDAVF